MKRISSLVFLLSCFHLLFAQTNEFELKVTVKPFKNQFIYLGHYFGKSYPIIDSAKLNDKSEAVFKRPKKLQGGIYLIGYPNKAGFFEILIDKQQKFSLIADTATISKGVKFINSPDNIQFNIYQQYMIVTGKKITTAQEQMKKAVTAKDSAYRKEELIRLDKEVIKFREEMIQKNPSSLLSALLITMREPQLTGRLKDPINKTDSLDSYNFYKNHYWDGVYFWDGRLAYTTLFEEKLDKYFTQLVVPQPDSIIKELDWMLGYASINDEMQRFLLIKFINRYMNIKYMWEDKVFVHLFENYFSQHSYPWLTEKGKKTIFDRAYSMMANLFGTQAADIELPDSSGSLKKLFSVNATYTVVIFWDPTCGHCKETLPRIDSIYQAKWKALDVKIFAIAKETDGTKKDWLNFIRDHNIKDWVQVYYSKADNDARVKNNIPSYNQLYDVQSVPTLYLLDKDKRISAKKIPFEQIDEVLDYKLKSK